MAGLKVSFYGSSLVSAYWNGAATYYWTGAEFSSHTITPTNAYLLTDPAVWRYSTDITAAAFETR